MYFTILTCQVILSTLSVSGRKGSYLPKCWAFMQGCGGSSWMRLDSENKIKFSCTKRAAQDLVKLGNDASIKANVRLEAANKKSTFQKDGKDIEFFKTEMRWVIVGVTEVLEEGTMPEPKKEEAVGDRI